MFFAILFASISTIASVTLHQWQGLHIEDFIITAMNDQKFWMNDDKYISAVIREKYIKLINKAQELHSKSDHVFKEKCHIFADIFVNLRVLSLTFDYISMNIEDFKAIRSKLERVFSRLAENCPQDAVTVREKAEHLLMNTWKSLKPVDLGERIDSTISTLQSKIKRLDNTKNTFFNSAHSALKEDLLRALIKSYEEAVESILLPGCTSRDVYSLESVFDKAYSRVMKNIDLKKVGSLNKARFAFVTKLSVMKTTNEYMENAANQYRLNDWDKMGVSECDLEGN